MSERLGPGGAAALALAVIGLAFFALRPGSTQVTITDSPEIEHPPDGSAVIARLSAAGGLAPFGVQIIDSTHVVEVQFLTDGDCAAHVSSGDPWPTEAVGCSTDVEVVGEVAGLGRTATGQSIVGVQFDVSRDCYEALRTQETWPPDIPECS